MQAGERQVAPTIDGIRRDHRARYEFAKNCLVLGEGYTMLDVGCGVGYGSKILAERAKAVLAVDVNAEAIQYARVNYSHPRVTHKCAEVGDWLDGHLCYDAAVAFEVIEHVEDPRPMLKQLRRVAKFLIASVPNEEVFPWRGYKFHFRHYTRAEFRELLGECGWAVVGEWGQEGPESDVEPRVNGRTYVVTCERAAETAAEATTKKAPVMSLVERINAGMMSVNQARNELGLEPLPQVFEAVAPESVCILGLGPSLHSYLHNARCMGGRRELADEVWAVNALGDIIQCDRVFHMDDVHVQEARAAREPKSNIANMMKWLKTHPGPIYTGEVRSGYPGLVEYPLEDVLNSCNGQRYFNNTVPYAVAFAIHIGVKRIAIYGCDYTYPDAHQAEKGRACLEYWLGMARSRGIIIDITVDSTLMDTRERAHDPNLLYGYDGVKLEIGTDETGRIRVKRTPKSLPTAEEIEQRYNHDRHPNSLVEEGG